MRCYQLKSKCEICGYVTEFSDEWDIPVITIPAALNKYTNIQVNKYELCHNCYQKYKSFDNWSKYRYFYIKRFYYSLIDKYKQIRYNRAK